MDNLLIFIWNKLKKISVFIGDFIAAVFLFVFYFTIFAVFALFFKLFNKMFKIKHNKSQWRLKEKQLLSLDDFEKEF